MPGGEQGIKDNQPTIAELLKKEGYTSGQFGKNHLGDRDEMLPTNHGYFSSQISNPTSPTLYLRPGSLT